MRLGHHFHTDRSAALLVFSNLITIVLALLQQWDLRDIMWVYWGQSVIIGVFNWRRILDLKQFSTEGFSINNKPARPTRQTQRTTAWFFLFHYGFFHLAYLVFLIKERIPEPGLPALGIAFCTLIFLFNHRFSYRHNRERDMNRSPNIGTLMSFPYARIIPMHLTIVLGSHFAKDSIIELLLFLVLKTGADLLMHMVEHADARANKSVESAFDPMRGPVDN